MTRALLVPSFALLATGCGAYLPEEGVWDVTSETLNANTCGFASEVEDSVEIVGVDRDHFTLHAPDRAYSPFCALDGVSFVCDPFVWEGDLEEGLDAFMTNEFLASGVFDEDRVTIATVTTLACEGDDCDALAEGGATLPCSVEVGLVAEFSE